MHVRVLYTDAQINTFEVGCAISPNKTRDTPQTSVLIFSIQNESFYMQFQYY